MEIESEQVGDPHIRVKDRCIIASEVVVTITSWRWAFQPWERFVLRRHYCFNVSRSDLEQGTVVSTEKHISDRLGSSIGSPCTKPIWDSSENSSQAKPFITN